MSGVALVLDRAWSAMTSIGREPPQLVTVRSDDDVTLFDLGFTDPLGTLIGLLAPPSAVAVGLATGGWAIPPELLDEGGVDLDRGRLARRPSSHPDAVRVRTLVVVDRGGRGASRLSIAGGPPRDTELPEGFATDVLRRTLGLPTPAPAVSVDELVSAMWLAEIVTCSRVLGRRLTWSEALDLRVDAVTSWASARLLAGAGVWPGLAFSSEAAAWMDDGIFARWCLGSLPPLADLLTAGRRALRSSAWRELRLVVTPPS